jgi:hypothetical protein
VTGSKLSDIKVYFNDDNINKVEMLEQ